MEEWKIIPSYGCCITEEEEQPTRKHRPGIICMIVVTCIIFIGLQCVNILGPLIGIFINGPANVTNRFTVDLTPSNDVWVIWTVIYVWHFLILLFCVVSLRRTTNELKPVYSNPTLLSCFFFIYLSICYLATLGYILVWDRVHLMASTVIMFLATASLHMALIVSYRKLVKCTQILRNEGRGRERWFVIIIVQNGVAGYAAWTTVIFYINLTVSIVYWNVLPSGEPLASLICLVILVTHYLIYVITDLTVLDGFSGYVLAPYIVVIAAVAGMLKRNFRPGTTNGIVLVLFLTLSIICAIIKCIRMIRSMIIRQRTMPSPVDSNSTNTKGSNSSTMATFGTQRTILTGFTGNGDTDTDLDDISPDMFEMPPEPHPKQSLEIKREKDKSVDILPASSEPVPDYLHVTPPSSDSYVHNENIDNEPPIDYHLDKENVPLTVESRPIEDGILNPRYEITPISEGLHPDKPKPVLRDPEIILNDSRHIKERASDRLRRPLTTVLENQELEYPTVRKKLYMDEFVLYN